MARNFRILLLRLILSWWLIPGSWLIVWPIIFLMDGPDTANEVVCDFTSAMWFGGDR